MADRYIWYMTPMIANNLWMEMIAYRFIPEDEVKRIIEAEEKEGIKYVFNQAKKFYTGTVSAVMERKIATLETFAQIYDAHRHEWKIDNANLEQPVYTNQPHFDFISVLEDCINAFKRQKVEIGKILFKLDSSKLHIEKVLIEAEFMSIPNRDKDTKNITLQIGWK